MRVTVPHPTRAWAAAAVAAAVVGLGMPDRLQALDPERTLAQYIRDRWGGERGYPGGPVYALAQTGDGYLWIGSEKGLVRFDGLTFRLFEPTGFAPGTGPTVLGVTAAPDGTLWARLRGPALVRLRNGAFENILSSVGLPESVVTALFRGPGDVLLLSTLQQGAVSYRDGRFTTVAAAGSIPTSSFIISIAQTGDGDVWLGTRDAGLLRVQGPRVTRIMDGLPDLKINCLLAGEHGDLWIGTDKGVARWDGTEVTRSGVPPALNRVPALAMIRDRESNLWIAAAARGLLRVSGQIVATLADPDGRTASSVTAVFEDRDRNIWIGTTTGIERLRDGVFTTYSSAQGLPSDTVGAIHADRAQRLWFAPSQGGLYWLQDGQVGRIDQAGLSDDVVYSIAGSGDELWIGRQRGGLTRLRPQGRSFTAERFTQADGLAQNSVYAVHQARDGAVWAGTLSGGASRFKDGVFTTYTTANGLASNTVASILESADGTIWFGTPNGVSALSNGGWRRYAVADGLPSNDVNVLFEDSGGSVWAGTAGGLAVFRAGQLQTPVGVPGTPRGSILGLAEDRSGWLWITTADRLVRVRLPGLDDRTAAAATVREFGVADGLMALDGVKRHRSVVADARGRIWFAMSRGLSMVDPRRGDGRALPALIHVEDIAADGVPIDRGGPVQVPAGRRRITLSYVGLSLAVPERVLFRYRLDGFDQEWSAPVSDRQAAYTNLGPRSYVFRVTASNGDGLWNGAQATLPFEVEPSLWQTAWFRLSAALLGVVAGWSLYRLRVYQVARRLQISFEERLAERTRIAQELHDTLLQGFISASMQLHVASDRLPVDSPARPSLDRVLDLMQRVIAEGRNAVRGLRSASSPPPDLVQAFSDIHQDLRVSEQAEYRVIIEGKARPLNPIIRDEVYRIGREALFNAFRHSGAAAIELQLEYAADGLRMFVRDDGRGIDLQVVRTGRDGHWGIAGMRERAEAMGAQFRIRSRAAAGTEVELIVPGNVAFVEEKTRSRGWFIRRRTAKPAGTTGPVSDR
jgi:signal transduction histidine kinase/ligand-binding sensor domain-containing protein